ncbi:MAG: hypothetical protein CSA74_01565 [Rhodobacterales bacterium]|nr:MAG: hypothetical protein CSA74_01565 [Rhodobacterales bacterium]
MVLPRRTAVLTGPCATLRVARAAGFVAAVMLAGLVWLLPGGAAAQEPARAVSPIVILDRDALFARTLYGQRINREIESASTAMATETREIEAALEEEERALTEQRATLTPEAFRARAAAFDQKVQALRSEREALEADFLAQIEAARNDFFARIGPVLGQLVRDRGAVVIIDRRAVLLAAADIDITTEAVGRIDATLGDGARPGSGVTGGALPGPGSAAGGAGGPEGAGENRMMPVDTIPAPGAGSVTGTGAGTQN